jgi:hypothetical protein
MYITIQSPAPQILNRRVSKIDLQSRATCESSDLSRYIVTGFRKTTNADHEGISCKQKTNEKEAWHANYADNMPEGWGITRDEKHYETGGWKRGDRLHPPMRGYHSWSV